MEHDPAFAERTAPTVYRDGTLALSAGSFRRLLPPLIATLVALSAAAGPARLSLSANASDAQTARFASKGAETAVITNRRVWRLPIQPQGSFNLCALAVTGGGGCVFGVGRTVSVPVTLDSDVQEQCYAFSDRLLSGHPLKTEKGLVYFRTVAVSPDGRMLAAAMHSKQANRWLEWDVAVSCFSVGNGSVMGTATIRSLPFERAVSFSPSGEFVMCADCDGVWIFTTPKLESCFFLDRRSYLGTGEMIDAGFSGDGRYAAIVESKPELAAGTSELAAGDIGDTMPKATKQSPARSSVSPVTTSGSPDYKPGSLRTIDDGAVARGEYIKLIELRTKHVRSQISFRDHPREIALSSNGGMLAIDVPTQGCGCVEIWDTRRLKRIARLDGLSDALFCTFLPNSNVLAVRSYRSSSLMFFSIPSCRRIGTVEHAGICAFAFSYDGRSLAIGDEKEIIEVWDLDRAAPRANWPTRQRGACCDPVTQPGAVGSMVRDAWRL